MADFEYSHIVCNCNHVSLGEIVHAIEDKNAKTIDDIGDITD
ncbi:MAG: bacterioferritin-associated ferredoxin, partial [Arcobacteraceae bacterium]